ncbi:MAG: DNA gyrase inhibitor YacG [Polyangiaceae bacterium]
MTPVCPTCGGKLADPSVPSRPFCSPNCKLADLGRWLDGSYRIAGEPTDPCGSSVSEDGGDVVREIGPGWGSGAGEG